MPYLIILGLKLSLAGTFVAAAWGKLADQSPPLVTLHAKRHAAPLALPALEIFLSGFLLIGWHVYVATFLTTVFLISATLYLLTSGRGVPCHCFGRSQPLPWGLSVLRNLVLLSVSVYLLRESLPQVAPIRASELATEVVLCAAYTIGVILIWCSWTLTRRSPFGSAQRSGRVHE
jgi:hypothetical protein